ncbi:BAR-domain-containing protein [Russula vinacea]|nr:BAR-domain-containing protein [Russula vinacea]
MKGISKAIKRTPHMMTSKVGMSKKSSDQEFDDYQRNFALLETAAEKFLKDTKTFTDAVNTLFTSGGSLAQHFSILFHPIASEYDLLGKFPQAGHTIKNVDAYNAVLEELRMSISPELELIESRVVGPVKEFRDIMKGIRKMITKREHKLVDFDRFNNSLTKLRDKKEKSLNDEKNLFKLEQDFEIASNDYETINAAMKQDLPRFMMLTTHFINPLFHSFYYMQLNIFYMILDKINQFAEGKYTVDVSAAQIAAEYEEKRGDSAAVIEALSITQRFVSTINVHLIQEEPPSSTRSFRLRKASGKAFTGFSPTPSSHEAPPPPYSSPWSTAASAAAGKRAPPPPPPLKPKPARVNYVVALYDFSAQADGDLDFKVGDRIEVIERTDSSEDWWTGRLDGRTGVFPGNYVQEA